MRRKTIAVIVLFVSLFGVTILQAHTLRDGWISGRLLDKETLEPVVRAYIFTTDMKHRAVSDQDGNFEPGGGAEQAYQIDEATGQQSRFESTPSALIDKVGDGDFQH